MNIAHMVLCARVHSRSSCLWVFIFPVVWHPGRAFDYVGSTAIQLCTTHSRWHSLQMINENRCLVIISNYPQAVWPWWPIAGLMSPSAPPGIEPHLPSAPYLPHPEASNKQTECDGDDMISQTIKSVLYGWAGVKFTRVSIVHLDHDMDKFRPVLCGWVWFSEMCACKWIFIRRTAGSYFECLQPLVLDLYEVLYIF